MFNSQIRRIVHIGSVLAVTLALVFAFALPVKAQEYDCGTYGAGEYSNNESCIPAGSTGDSEVDSGGGGLSNTGQALSIVIPAAMIATGGIILYRLSRKNKATD